MLQINSISIPQSPGVYLFKGSKNQILYIGKAKNLAKRVQHYFTPNSVRKQDMLAQAINLEYITTRTEHEAYLLEANLIKKHQPPYNMLLKADNSYVFIKITREDFAQINLSRKRLKDDAYYIGPKQHTKELKNLLHYLRMIYKFRTSNKKTFLTGKLDTDFFFGLDAGRSVIYKIYHSKKNTQELVEYARKHGLVLDKAYQEYVQIYQQIVQDIIAFFQGNTRPVIQRIHTEIQDAIQKQHFERAAKLRDILKHIDLCTQKQSIFLSTSVTGFAAKIIRLENRRIFAILTLYEGKVIDVIRGKQSIREIGPEGIQSRLRATYEDFYCYNQYYNKITFHQDISAVYILQKSMKNLSSEDRKGLKEFLDNAVDSYITSTSLQQENLLNTALAELQKRYKLHIFPYHIECIDISHLSGGRTSGGLSCLIGGIKYPRGYRRYKIKSVKTLDKKSNDYLAIQELLSRRLLHTKQIPHLLIIDGGKGQLAVVQKMITTGVLDINILEQVQFVALEKGKAKHDPTKDIIKEKLHVLKYTKNPAKRRIFRIDTYTLCYDASDKILLCARDEAHRFANAYRKKQMQAERKNKLPTDIFDK